MVYFCGVSHLRDGRLEGHRMQFGQARPSVNVAANRSDIKGATSQGVNAAAGLLRPVAPFDEIRPQVGPRNVLHEYEMSS